MKWFIRRANCQVFGHNDVQALAFTPVYCERCGQRAPDWAQPGVVLAISRSEAAMAAAMRLLSAQITAATVPLMRFTEAMQGFEWEDEPA